MPRLTPSEALKIALENLRATHPDPEVVEVIERIEREELEKVKKVGKGKKGSTRHTVPA